MQDARFEEHLDPFRDYLAQRGLGRSTIRAYVGIVRAYLEAHPKRPTHVDTIVHWAEGRLATAPAGSSAIWTVGLRAWMSHHRLDPNVIKAPPRPIEPEAAVPLTDDELEAYHRAVELCEHPAVRCILHLLPLEGLAVGDVCRLRVGYTLRNPDGAEALREYLAFHPASGWLFPSLSDPAAPMSTDTVRKQLRTIRRSADWTTRRLRLSGMAPVAPEEAAR